MSNYTLTKFEPQPTDLSDGFNAAEDYRSGEASPVDAQRFIVFVLRYWWVPVLTVALAVGLAVACILNIRPTFSSEGKMWETEKMRLPGESITEDMQDYISTQIRLLKSEKMAELTMQRLQSQKTPIPLEAYTGLELALHRLTAGTNEDVSKPHPARIKLAVAQAPKTTVIELTASSVNRAYSQAYLNALMEGFLQYKKSVRGRQSGDTFNSIDTQAVSMKQQLKDDQDALTDFERTNNLAVLQSEAGIAGEYLTRLKTQLSGLELESQFLDATTQEPDWAGQSKNVTSGFLIDSQPAANLLPGGSSTSPSPLNNDRQTVWSELETLKIQREALSKNLRPEHPRMVKLDQDIAQGQKLIDKYRSQSKSELDAAQKALELSSQSVQKSIKQWDAKVLEANKLIAEADRLKLSVTRTQTLYDRLVTLLQNVDISRDVDREFLAIFEPAGPAVRSLKQDIILLVLALAGGFGGGLGIIFLVQVRDDRFSSLTEVSDTFRGGVFGQVPDMAGRKKTALRLENGNQRDIWAESYRSLRSALLFPSSDGQRPKVVLITSAVPQEGKSTIAANLARALAFGGSRVLLVDGDLRKGALHQEMGRPLHPGLAELLRNPDEADKIIHANVVPNLSFIARGRSVGHPGDLLLRPELDHLLARWREQFDHVVIDSCPVFAADDVTALANKVDGTLFVVRRHFSTNAAVHEALESLLRKRANVLGLVFNRADVSKHSYRYYKYSDYHCSEDEKADSRARANS